MPTTTTAAVIVFPGSNCDRDMKVALEAVTGTDVIMHWHRDTELPDVDLIAVPGGFSYGDYLRSGAMAANSPVMRTVARPLRERASVPPSVSSPRSAFPVKDSACASTWAGGPETTTVPPWAPAPGIWWP